MSPKKVEDCAAPPGWSDDDLARLHAAGRAAWPSLDLPRGRFGQFLHQRFATPAAVPPETVPDLFLVCACVLDLPGALRCFRDGPGRVVAAAVTRFDDSPAFAEEVYQRMSEVLFVGGPSSSPKIARYSGQGALAGFVATAARRIALRMATTSARFAGEEELVQQLSSFQGEETLLLKARYREIFNRALSVALRDLPRRERLILRMNLIERISTTRIAAMYKVTQPTVSRWIHRSASSIFATVKDLVCDELEIDTRELESLLLLVRSQIEVTISQAEGSVTQTLV